MQKFLQVLNKHIGTAEIPCAKKKENGFRISQSP